MRVINKGLVATGWLALFAGACGQDPSFVDLEKDGNAAGIDDEGRSADASTDEDAIDNFGKEKGVLGDVVGTGPSNGGGGTDDNGNPIDPDDYEIPSIPDGEQDAVRRCMSKWGRNPFPATITNVKRMVAVTVGGIGNAINDTETTSEPQLVVIAAGVNVGGEVTYNLMNRNAYYCMIVNVNVNTDLDINLNCNARLADSLVNVAVGSTMTGNTARIGVHVNSNVTINTVRPNGQECVR